MDPMGYIVYNRLLRIIIVMYFPAIYHRRHFSSCRSRSLPKKFSSPITTTLPKAPAKLIFINPNLQFFKKSSKLQKQNMQFTMFFRFCVVFSPTTTTTTPTKQFFGNKGGTQLPATCSHLGAGAKGFVEFFSENWGIGNTWRIGPH